MRGTVTASVVGSACAHDRQGPEAHATEAPRAAGSIPASSVEVETVVNGKPRALQVHPDDSALEVVRRDLALTGCKLACGHGACGACTMQLDGETVASCLLPASALHGRRVTTIEGVEGLAAGGGLHPVQRAFMAQDALQCGYCTPGFIVEAVAFYDRWRTEHGDTEPSRDEVASALAGHLCRCGAYDDIVRAVQNACAGAHETGSTTTPRYDAYEKVTGQARYTVDIEMKGLLHAKAVTSPHAHAIVRKLDTSKATALPGVRGVVTLVHEEGRVRYAGQEILAIAAQTERIAEEAVALVDIDYEVLPAALDLDTARAEGAPSVYPRRGKRTPENASEGPLLPEPWHDNVRGPLKLFSKQPRKARREIEAARRDGTVVEQTFTTAVQCHTTLEPHAAVARWEGEDELRVWLSTQAVSHLQRDIAERWKLSRERVQVLSEYIGGGFGAKATLQSEVVVAVELAKVCGAPVRYVRDRRGELTLGGSRPGTSITLAAATDRTGELTGIDATTYSTSGVAVGHAVTPVMRVIYPKVPKALAEYDVVTHAAPAKPFRGPGGPQALWAIEQGIDALAHARGEEPLALRRRVDPNPARAPLYQWAQELDAWANRPRPSADRGRFRRGIGVACGAWFAFAEPKSRARIDAGPSGIVVSTAAQDMGNGTRTVLAETAARELGMRPSDIEVRIGDSRFVHGPMSGGSRTTSSLVPAVVHACAQLREELLDVARAREGRGDLVATPAGIELGEGRGVQPWSEILSHSEPVTVVGRRRRDSGGYVLPPIMGLAIERYLTASVQVVEVEVDTRLGRIRITEAWGGFGTGKLVSPVLARSQAKGGFLQAMSYTLYEERRLDPTRGFLLTTGLEDYRVIGIGDIPRDIHVYFHERGYEKVRQRSVGLAELVTLAPPAAIANAVFHATGWRPTDLPIRPDRVLQGVRS